MAKRDYYQVLDIPRTATRADVKKAYRRLAMKSHPDRNPDDKDAEEKFKEAKEAYEILCEADKRAIYDQHGHAGIDATRQGGGRGGAGADAFGEMFGEMFGDISAAAGAAAGVRRSFRGADLKYELEIELSQAVFGYSVEIDVARLMECDTCGGSGAAKGHKPVTCETCNGVGQVRISQGFFSCSNPVRNAVVPERSSRIPATPASVRVAFAAASVSRSRFPRVSIPGIAFGSPARANPDATGGRPATCTWKSMCANTRSSSAMANTCPVRCRSVCDRGTRWQRGCAHSRWSCLTQDSFRNAVRARIPPARQGREARARWLAWRPVLPRSR